MPTCNSEFDQCYTIIIDNEIHRGCVSADDSYFPNAETTQKCTNPADCAICKDLNGCNSDPVTDVCTKCNGSDSTSHCVNNPNAEQVVPCSLKNYSKESKGCYLSITGDTYIRGCMRDLNLNEQIACRGKSEHCKSCNSPNCNQKQNSSPACYECSGDNMCVYSVDSASKVNCYDYTKTCVNGIDKNGLTNRGCVSYDLLESEFPLGYKTCPKNLCNNEIFPSDRLKCYQCKGDNECVTLDNLGTFICNHYLDQCYAYYSGKSI